MTAGPPAGRNQTGRGPRPCQHARPRLGSYQYILGQLIEDRGEWTDANFVAQPQRRGPASAAGTTDGPASRNRVALGTGRCADRARPSHKTDARGP